MANEKQDASAAPGGAGDDDSAVQEELRREAKEGKGLIGDTASDRNVTGSSTWITLPENEQGDGSGGSEDGGTAR
jgi:hypothetical protein